MDVFFCSRLACAITSPLLVFSTINSARTDGQVRIQKKSASISKIRVICVLLRHCWCSPPSIPPEQTDRFVSKKNPRPSAKSVLSAFYFCHFRCYPPTIHPSESQSRTGLYSKNSDETHEISLY